jgi:hypothetical protein
MGSGMSVMDAFAVVGVGTVLGLICVLMVVAWAMKRWEL